MFDFTYTPHSSLNIDPNEVHIWLISPSLVFGNIQNKIDLLSFDESLKATRFHFEKDRHLYETAHISLRLILSLYQNISPAKIKFVFGKNGKPFLEKTQNPRNIAFNLSHTFDLVAVGITSFPQIGIDVEFTDSKEINRDLISQISTKEEFKIYEKQSLSLQNKLFFKLWTRKEALLKASGTGLSIEPNQVCVEPNDISPLIELTGNGFTTNSLFKLRDFQVGDFHMGSVAVQTEDFEPIYRKFTF